MCGLFGLISNRPLDETDIQRCRSARDTLSHRGPDQVGEWTEGRVYVGHRRLSIIDVSAVAQQPLCAGGIVATVNGEIYNFQALRDQLESKGHIFKSKSDSEVVLHGYREWGAEGLATRLEGMYAVVLWDSAKGELFAFRDRVGIKPLYWYFNGKKLAWASELRAIVSYMRLDSGDIAPEAIVDFLTYKYIPAPKSLYRNCYKLAPATILRFSQNQNAVETRPYWKLHAEESQQTYAAAEERLRELLEVSVLQQTMSDVPLGLLLSGGIDSSAVAIYASKGVTLHSFSMGFDGPNDETPHAIKVAQRAGTNHLVCHFHPSDVDHAVERMAFLFDEPFADYSALPTYRVCSFAQETVTVALTGDGGDELFGGYRLYNVFEKAINRNCLDVLRSKLLFQRRDPLRIFAKMRGAINERQLANWKSRLEVPADYDELWAYRAHYHPDRSARQNARVMDFHTYLPDAILTKLDRASMAVSLECRPPFLSTPLVEFAFSLPESFLFSEGNLKGGLKRALDGILPRTILNREKQGFGVGVPNWKERLAGNKNTVENLIVDYFLTSVPLARKRYRLPEPGQAYLH